MLDKNVQIQLLKLAAGVLVECRVKRGWWLDPHSGSPTLPGQVVHLPPGQATAHAQEEDVDIILDAGIIRTVPEAP